MDRNENIVLVKHGNMIMDLGLLICLRLVFFVTLNGKIVKNDVQYLTIIKTVSPCSSTQDFSKKRICQLHFSDIYFCYNSTVFFNNIRANLMYDMRRVYVHTLLLYSIVF